MFAQGIAIAIFLGMLLLIIFDMLHTGNDSGDVRVCGAFALLVKKERVFDL